MRVVGGTFGSRRLAKPPPGVRPTSDRVRESLFNRLMTRGVVEGARVLDLFAGTGALAIEALSRGAKNAVFVDRSRPALAVVEQNLARLGLEDRARVLRGDALDWVVRLSEEPASFDLVLLDPPYQGDLGSRALDLIAGSALLADDGTLVFETSKRHSLPHVSELCVRDQRRYGDTTIVELVRSAQHGTGN